MAKARGFSLPFVWNTGGYERAETLRALEGLVDIYLTDYKYASGELAARYSAAADYPAVAEAALREMVRQQPACVYDSDGELLTRGVIVRHLVLPTHADDSCKVVRRVFDAYGKPGFDGRIRPRGGLCPLARRGERLYPGGRMRVREFYSRI